MSVIFSSLISTPFDRCAHDLRTLYGGGTKGGCTSRMLLLLLCVVAACALWKSSSTAATPHGLCCGCVDIRAVFSCYSSSRASPLSTR